MLRCAPGLRSLYMTLMSCRCPMPSRIRAEKYLVSVRQQGLGMGLVLGLELTIAECYRDSLYEPQH